MNTLKYLERRPSKYYYLNTTCSDDISCCAKYAKYIKLLINMDVQCTQIIIEHKATDRFTVDAL